ncbi:putative membrane protein [Lyngbya aestuarii BL J]|uniref:Putative membrane protein n=1 Tax=Lyngbya aestuarii BL J TaxID=1348334 RepID=U7QM89_9CYAN|nr:putative membrane protein [Lyngbya aestuarii BL J]
MKIGWIPIPTLNPLLLYFPLHYYINNGVLVKLFMVRFSV